jgi:bacteriophage N4 adsorption protein B
MIFLSFDIAGAHVLDDYFIFVIHELMLFAVVGFLLGGVDDLLIDMIWITRNLWRCLFIYGRHDRVDARTLVTPENPGRMVIFIPAWDEANVIGRMLDHALHTIRHDDYRIYVGCYPNDSDTIAAINAVGSPFVRLVVGGHAGPTTKADCLNTLWNALRADEVAQGFSAKAVILHDAEDIIHSAELRVFDTLIERFDLVQLPVLPLIDPQSRWIGGHYCDEFAEAHGKTMVVREALGAAIPAAGVGCAFSRELLAVVATERGGEPFDRDSLTEDYEIGLRLSAYGGRGAFVRLPGVGRKSMVGVRAHFPATLEAAVRQKSRWITGIALAGWDRLGWRGGLAETWMRLHDRRALLAAVVLVAGYAAMVLTSGLWVAHHLIGTRLFAPTPLLGALLSLSGTLLLWRLAMRCLFVTRAYGWREGLRAIPRAVIGNVIAIMAARRALWLYLTMRRDGVVRWDKTRHVLPDHMPAE